MNAYVSENRNGILLVEGVCGVNRKPPTPVSVGAGGRMHSMLSDPFKVFCSVESGASVEVF